MASPLVVRDHNETHRQASWLELFFDLTFVVAVAQAARQLEHSAAEGHVGADALIVVCSVWWIYFDFTTGQAPVLGKRSQYLWGYGHYSSLLRSRRSGPACRYRSSGSRIPVPCTYQNGE